LSEHLDKLKGAPYVCEKIGESVGKLHNNNIVHGDLTTSNMILSGKGKDKKLFFVDFGLGFYSKRLEDKAVDVHVFKQALEAKHYKKYEEFLKAFLKGYEKTCEDSGKVLEQLKKVEARGRYRH
jgi:Kae1-associated kinase Bud32